MILPSPRGWISAKQSPPMPVDCGSITPSTAEPATAASTAVPPSRTEANRAVGLQLSEKAGATLTSTEAVLFDLLGSSDTPEFKELSKLIR